MPGTPYHEYKLKTQTSIKINLTHYPHHKKENNVTTISHREIVGPPLLKGPVTAFNTTAKNESSLPIDDFAIEYFLTGFGNRLVLWFLSGGATPNPDNFAPNPTPRRESGVRGVGSH